MRRTALVRRTPLPRQTRPIKRSPIRYRPPRRLKTTQSDPHYLAFVRLLPCCVEGMVGAGPCQGLPEANHAGKRPGIGMKAPDTTAIPMCHRHHEQWTGTWGNRGAFIGWFPEERREWADERIAETHVLAVLRGVVT